MRTYKFLLRALILTAIAIALTWPAFFNGGPFYTPDTRTYMRGADAAVNKLTHKTTEWTAPDDKSSASTAASQNREQQHNSADARTRSLQEIGKRGVLASRSPYYGLLLYLGAIAGGFWLTIFLQAGVSLLAIYLTLRALNISAWPNLAYLGIGLCFLSDLPFFTSYLLPDVFAGIAILACGLLISSDRRFGRSHLLLWCILLSATMLFHDSCTLISLSLLAFAIPVNLIRRSWINWRGLCVILLAAVTAYSGQSIVSYGVKRVTGRPPMRLPFLSARLVADGPGTSYLRATCPQSGFTLCEYAAEFPILDAEFLFGSDPKRSVFETASYDQRRAISDEQFRFFFAVLRYDPAGVLKTSARNAAMQLLDFRLVDLNYDPSMKVNMSRTFPESVFAQVRSSAAFNGTVPVVTLSILQYVFVLVALAWLLFVFFAAWRKGAEGGKLERILCWVLAGIVINAVVCGALSAVDPRYQARVVWLIPLLALLAWFKKSSIKSVL